MNTSELELSRWLGATRENYKFPIMVRREIKLGARRWVASLKAPFLVLLEGSKTTVYEMREENDEERAIRDRNPT